MTDTKGVDGVPALGISLNAQIDGRRQLVFQTHVDGTASVGEINQAVDKMNAVIDRAVAFYQIEELETAVERDKQQLYSMNHTKDDMEIRLQEKWEESGKRGPFKLSNTEKTQKSQAMDTIRRQTEILRLSEQRLAEAKAKAGNRDVAPSPANR